MIRIVHETPNNLWVTVFTAHYQLFFQSICIIIIIIIIIIITILTQLSLLAGGTYMGDRSGKVLPQNFVIIIIIIIIIDIKDWTL